MSLQAQWSDGPVLCTQHALLLGVTPPCNSLDSGTLGSEIEQKFPEVEFCVYLSICGIIILCGIVSYRMGEWIGMEVGRGIDGWTDKWTSGWMNE